MTKTDSKNWNACFQKLFDFFYNSNVFCRVSRTVTQHNSVRIQGCNLLCCVGARHSYNFKTAFQKFAADICLCTKVPENNLFSLSVFHGKIRIVDFCSICLNRNKAVFCRLAENYVSRLFNSCCTSGYRSNCIYNCVGTDFFQQGSLFAFIIQGLECGFCFVAFARNNHPVHNAGFAQNLCEFSCINVVKTNYILRFEVRIDVAAAAEVRRSFAPFTDNVAAKIAFCTFVIFCNIAVVSNQRKSLSYNLTVIAWICKCFKIAVHTGSKNCFSDNTAFSSKTFSFKNHAVCQKQNSFFFAFLFHNLPHFFQKIARKPSFQPLGLKKKLNSKKSNSAL